MHVVVVKVEDTGLGYQEELQNVLDSHLANCIVKKCETISRNGCTKQRTRALL